MTLAEAAIAMPAAANVAAVLLAGLVAMASPGPATIAISRAAMSGGRRDGLHLALGVATGSAIWCLAAAGGLGAVMVHHAWLQDVLRYLAAGYLFYLAVHAARAALAGSHIPAPAPKTPAPHAFLTGLGLHLTNPKPVLFYGALFSAGLPADIGIEALALVVILLCLLALAVFTGLALLFANQALARGYAKLKRWFETLFAALFGAASARLLIVPLASPSNPSLSP